MRRPGLLKRGLRKCRRRRVIPFKRRRWKTCRRSRLSRPSSSSSVTVRPFKPSSVPFSFLTRRKPQISWRKSHGGRQTASGRRLTGPTGLTAAAGRPLKFRLRAGCCRRTRLLKTVAPWQTALSRRVTREVVPNVLMTLRRSTHSVVTRGRRWGHRRRLTRRPLLLRETTLGGRRFASSVTVLEIGVTRRQIFRFSRLTNR